MEILVVASSQLDTNTAISEVLDKSKDFQPSIVFLAFNTDLDGETLTSQLTQRFNCPIIGSSSYKGALCSKEEDIVGTATLCLFLLSDPTGNYGVGHKEIREDAQLAAQEALDMALYSSDRGYESPSLIWCTLPPGQEEAIIRGFSQVVGVNVPVFGGSSADNDVTGGWQQVTDISAGTNQISVAVLYPSRHIATSFSSGYEPTDESVIVNKADNRLLKVLDNQPAAEKYNAMAHGIITEHLEGGNILNLTTLHPLGKKIRTSSGVDEYILSHPKAVTPQGEVALFSDVATNDVLFLMQGNKKKLLFRATKVIKNAIDLLPDNSTVKGVLLVYCAGCMLTIEEDLPTMLQSLKRSFNNIPILGFYTFGEQGHFLDGNNRHGNLMVSAVAFS